MSEKAHLPLNLRGLAIALTICGSSFFAQPVDAQQTDLPGPANSGAFGSAVAVLPNGNIVITDPKWGTSSQGAVYLYSPSGSPLNHFTGSSAKDQVGSGGITVLTNGNFVISSPNWSNGAATAAGAVTWVNGVSGLSGTVSALNSLVGSTAGDNVGSGITVPLPNGNYVVISFNWSNGNAAQAGAVTWADGNAGISGPVTPGNSLVGATAGDEIGQYGVYVLSNGNYVVNSPYWHSGAIAAVGAVTWGNGSSGISGVVSTSNSLVGSTGNDKVGLSGITSLANGNYVVRSPDWSNGANAGAGAATWGNGSTGTSGVVSAENSLVGTAADEAVGSSFITPLVNGNYVIATPNWSNGAISEVGAVTWANGTTALAGTISTANSLVGTTANDQVGSGGIAPLTNGNFVVASFLWANGAATKAGAVTWGNGSTGLTGVVSTANSLVGTTANDEIGFWGVFALGDGNYVVASPLWNNGSTAKVGAATWLAGSASYSGTVSAANSLIGTKASDEVGYGGIVALPHGSYLVVSHYWGNGSASKAGAVTWLKGDSATSGVVSTTNSLVGSNANDQVGTLAALVLSNGNYCVLSPNWSNGANAQAGAVTWANGNQGTAGPVSAANSLVGTSPQDYVGEFFPWKTASNGSLIFLTPYWNNAMGAVSLIRGNGGVVGPISSTNSVRGTAADGGFQMTFDYDAARDQVVVGQPASNIVSLFKADLLFADGFE